VQLCPIVIELLPDAQAPCPAMEFSGERFWCGLIRRPSRYLGTPLQSDRVIGPMASVELAIGQATQKPGEVSSLTEPPIDSSE
jgi:hypothetical protein